MNTNKSINYFSIYVVPKYLVCVQGLNWFDFFDPDNDKHLYMYVRSTEEAVEKVKSIQSEKPNDLIEVYFMSRVCKEDIGDVVKLLNLIPHNVFIQSKYGSVTVNKRLSHV